MDSLKLALKNAKHDTVRCNILNALSETASDEEWPKYSAELFKLSESKIKTTSRSNPEYRFYQKNLAAALYGFGYLAWQQTNMPKALDYLEKSLKISEEILDKKGISVSSYHIANIYLNQSEANKALEYLGKSLKAQEEIGDQIAIAKSLNDIGLAYQNLGIIDQTFKYFYRSLKVSEEIGDKETIANTLVNLGYIFHLQGDSPKALEYYKRSLKIREEMGDKKGVAQSLNNIGGVYHGQSDITKQLEYFGRSLKIYEEIGNKDGIAYSFNNIGLVYDYQGDYSKALEYYHKSLRIREDLGDNKGLALALSNVGSVYLKQKNYNKAIEFTTRSMKVSKELGYPFEIRNSAITLSNTYNAIGNYKLALENYKLYTLMRDSINNDGNRKASIKQQLKYEYERQATADSVAHAKESEVKNAQLAQQKAEISAKQNQQYALFGGLVLVVVFAGFMYSRFKVTQRQKMIIEQKEKETHSQKEIIEEKHKEITDSINYAERIQRSFLATQTHLNENLNDYFVLFKPKDVVSGDFYWTATLANGRFALATADSTGHGVPGAIMSLLNITSLEKAIETITDPSEILNTTRKIIIERLKKDGSEEGGKDGMDCSLCVYDFRNLKLFVSAAHNPVWIIRASASSARSEVIEVKADKMPVGKHDRQDIPFTLQEVELQKGDVVYTLTDGFPDQFGGEKGKKFMSKNLRELLAANSNLPMKEQKQLLEKTFAEWLGNLEQVDDVTLIGVRV
ncbi:MAG: tetratricopeptide repeat protein [Bacteroidetes bacterium]|nr:tetratricopeptide repeat protein [Bacteroidota bacterium]